MARTSFKRTDRVGAELRREVGTLVHMAVKDGLLPDISVSDVEVTRDFSHATVYFTTLDNDAAAPAQKLLKEFAKEFRMQLAKRLRLRNTPELHFRYDDSVEKGERIEHLLRASAVASATAESQDGPAATDGIVDGDSDPRRDD
jgi:ribosome-binding factor A